MVTNQPRRATRIGSRTLVRRSSGEQAALYIRQLIFDGALRPGQRVPQDDIAAALGVSRIPLREALIALEREGWVTIEIHRGAFVNALSPETVQDHFELFGIIYGFAIHRAMERSGDTWIQHMVELQADLAAATDPTKAVELIFGIYRAIVDGARSPRLRVILRAISTLVPGDFFEEVPTAIEVERKSLAAMVRALKRHDADKAADEYARMLRQVSREVTELFRERGLFEKPMDAGDIEE
jgi:DNA-binding GntR family transcriptional regulator